MVNLYFEQFDDQYDDDTYWMDDYYEVDDSDYNECGCCCCTGDCYYDYEDEMYDDYVTDLYDDGTVG